MIIVAVWQKVRFKTHENETVKDAEPSPLYPAGPLSVSDRHSKAGVCLNMMRRRLASLMALLAAATAVACLLPGALAQMTYTKFCKGLELTQLDYAETRDVGSLKSRLTEMIGGCQYIHGDLVLKDLGVDPASGRLLDASIQEMETDFLDTVVEISGRLVLHQVALRRVQLKNLRAIRGAGTTAGGDAAALEVTMCAHPMELLLPSLTAIVRGDVRMISVADIGLYCRLSGTIDWSVAFQLPGQKFRVDLTGCTRDGLPVLGNCTCGEADPPLSANCSADCPNGRCWSSTVCQASGRCSRHRPCSNCYRDPHTGEQECCSQECLGGCTGPGARACNSCLRVTHDGECRETCPALREYNFETMKFEASKDPMVHVGNVCEKRCPTQFVLDLSRQYCLATCPASETPVEGNCTRCEESGGNSDSDCRVCYSRERTVTGAMTAEFSNCSVWQFALSATIDGSLVPADAWAALGSAKYIYASTFTITRAESMAANLSLLSSLRHVSGELMLRNLRTGFLGLSNLETSKHLVLFKIDGLCRAWFPERHLLSTAEVGPSRRYRVTVRDVNFAPEDEPACAGAACDPQCRDTQCWGPGPGMCVACAGVRMRGVCHPDCATAGGFPNPERGVGHNRADCLPCHPQCGPGGCGGPGPEQCATCLNYREAAVCVAACGSHLEAGSDRVCYAAAAARFAGLAAGLAALVLALLVLGLLGWRHYQRRVHKYDVVELDEYLADPSNPNDMVKLLIVNDDDVVKQKEIGSGAFGTVFRGLLRTDTVKGLRELPVAIKVLRGSNPKLGQELLNEAGVLARVQHPHCVRLVALCMTAEVQLITALMPRGCLLGFLRDHRGGIGAERMLSWAQQVAEGMAYLESISIVHRDLAARNVLLKTPDEVKITDFGLARLLEESETQFLYTSGALPVKWLGIECFESGVFSHKSDVWSYGVLLWEICSYGESPYKPYRIASVEDITGLLKKGIRLNQPDICSVDFYNIMLACWLPYPDSRPSFVDLTATMKDCLLCPSRYIASRAGVDEEIDMEKAELVHSQVQHRPVEAAGPRGDPDGHDAGYARMSAGDPAGGGAAMEPDRKERALMNAAAANAATAAVAGGDRRGNSYVNEPRLRRQPALNSGHPGPEDDDNYLEPRAAPAAAAADEAGYMVPQYQQPQHQEPIGLDDDYLAPTKC